jgi:hypothetical protein
LWDKVDQESIRNNLQDFTQTFTTNTYANIDYMWITIKNFLTDLINRHILRIRWHLLRTPTPHLQKISKLAQTLVISEYPTCRLETQNDAMR